MMAFEMKMSALHDKNIIVLEKYNIIKLMKILGFYVIIK